METVQKVKYLGTEITISKEGKLFGYAFRQIKCAPIFSTADAARKAARRIVRNRKSMRLHLMTEPRPLEKN